MIIEKEVKILIMEDIPFWGMMLGRELKKFGVHSDWVKNGKLGVDKIRQSSIDYHGVITDIQMPVMDGLEATRRIRELGFKKPIVGFSSMGENEDIDKGLAIGMNGYFRKSIDEKTIKGLLVALEIKQKS